MGNKINWYWNIGRWIKIVIRWIRNVFSNLKLKRRIDKILNIETIRRIDKIRNLKTKRRKNYD